MLLMSLSFSSLCRKWTRKILVPRISALSWQGHFSCATNGRRGPHFQLTESTSGLSRGTWDTADPLKCLWVIQVFKGNTAFGREAHISVSLKTREISHRTNKLTKALLFLGMTSECKKVLNFSLFILALSRNSSATATSQKPFVLFSYNVGNTSFLSSDLLVKATYWIWHTAVKLCLYIWHCQFYHVGYIKLKN